MDAPVKKRWRMVDAKPDQLRVAFGLFERGEEPELVYAWGEGTQKADVNLLMSLFEGRGEEVANLSDGSIVQEFAKRGYDITTLKFTIQRNKP